MEKPLARLQRESELRNVNCALSAWNTVETGVRLHVTAPLHSLSGAVKPASGMDKVELTVAARNRNLVSLSTLEDHLLLS